MQDMPTFSLKQDLFMCHAATKRAAAATATKGAAAAAAAAAAATRAEAARATTPQADSTNAYKEEETPLAQDHGDPSRPINLQDRVCGLAHKQASALAAGWLK